MAGSGSFFLCVLDPDQANLNPDPQPYWQQTKTFAEIPWLGTFRYELLETVCFARSKEKLLIEYVLLFIWKKFPVPQFKVWRRVLLSGLWIRR